MVNKQNVWAWVVSGAALAYWLTRPRGNPIPSVDIAVGGGSGGGSGGGNVTLISATQVPGAAPSAPVSVFARPCVFVTSDTHELFSALDAPEPAALLLSYTQVTIVGKQVVDGAVWFAARIVGTETVPNLSGSIVRNPLWFQPSAAERARCT